MSIINTENSTAPFALPQLPFEDTVLEPALSKESFDYHHKKHHNAYVVKLNELIEGTPYASLSLKEIIIKAENENKPAIFNNAAQIWNHSFFWHSLSKNGGTKNITTKAKAAIEGSFGSVEEFQTQFIANGVGQFGSGWVWLVQNLETKKLEIVKTPNAQTPLTNPNLKPIITADVWEHAYYINYRNQRPAFLKVFVEELLNWSFVENNLV